MRTRRMHSRQHTGAGGGKGNKKGHSEGVFNGVVRAKGHLWIASANAYPVDIHIAGESCLRQTLYNLCAQESYT